MQVYVRIQQVDIVLYGFLYSFYNIPFVLFGILEYNNSEKDQTYLLEMIFVFIILNFYNKV